MRVASEFATNVSPESVTEGAGYGDESRFPRAQGQATKGATRRQGWTSTGNSTRGAEGIPIQRLQRRDRWPGRRRPSLGRDGACPSRTRRAASLKVREQSPGAAVRVRSLDAILPSAPSVGLCCSCRAGPCAAAKTMPRKQGRSAVGFRRSHGLCALLPAFRPGLGPLLNPGRQGEPRLYKMSVTATPGTMPASSACCRGSSTPCTCVPRTTPAPTPSGCAHRRRR